MGTSGKRKASPLQALIPLDNWPVEQYAVGGPLPAHYRGTPGSNWGQASAIGGLLFSETVGPDLVVAYFVGIRTSVALIRAGTVQCALRVRFPGLDHMGANEHDQAEFDLAVRTAEAAVRVLTARTARSPEEAEAIEHAAADGKVIDLLEGTRRRLERRSSKAVV